MRTIALLNWKGGSAKTTTALALSVGLAQQLPKGQRVLLVDSDPQANATLVMLDGAIPEPPTLTDVLLDDADAVEAIRKTRVDRLDILPADRRLRAERRMLLDEVDLGRERRLQIALKSVENAYTVCVVDCPPHSSILTTNVMQAVSEIIVPIDPGLFAIAGLGELQASVSRARKYLDHANLAVSGLLVTRATGRPATTELVKELRDVYGSLVYRIVIPADETVEDAHASYRTVMEWAPKSSVAKAYGKLVTEVLGNVGPANKRTRKRSPKPRHAA